MEKENIGFNKFQYSYFVNGDQVVIRSNDSKDFAQAIKEALEIIPKVPSEVTQQTHEKSIEAGGHKKMCYVHNVYMDEKISKKTGKPYFAHTNGSTLCFGNE